LSSDIPKIAAVLGSVTPPQGDIIDLVLHLGCTKEVSSFDLLLQNWDQEYSPGGTTPILVGVDGHIDVGRGTNVPQLITCRVESIKCFCPNPNEYYMLVSGRCWGEKLFRRVVTKTYTSQKGEAIVKDLMDSYALLSHTRSATELVEDTDTTFTLLEYEDTPLWDVLKYIAESSDKAGVIGYDFRVAPDGKFEFFPKNSKTSSVSLTEIAEVSEYRKDIHRVRNKIMIYGLADKSVPLDKDLWTEAVHSTDGIWTSITGEPPVFDTVSKVKGTGSIKLHGIQAYYEGAVFTIDGGKEVNSNLYPTLSFYLALQQAFSGNVSICLIDTSAREAWKHVNIGLNEWQKVDVRVGAVNAGDWSSITAGFDWSALKVVRIDCWFAGIGSGYFWVDSLYFGGRRYAAMQEDVPGSQTSYGLREFTETDEELNSDLDCNLRAKALLDYFKDPAEYLTVESSVIDYALDPSLPGDKIHVELPNENVDSDFRIESVEYHVDARQQTLIITYELGKVPPQIADYLYGLRATTVTVEKLARTKLGKRGVPSVSYGGGLGNHHLGHETGDDTGAQWASDDDGGWDKIEGWIAPKFIGPFNDSAAIIQFRTKNKAANTVVDHEFNPSDDLRGILGSSAYRWKEVNTKYLLLPSDGYVQLKTFGEANPRAKLDLELLQFGPGGSTALDTWLKRTGVANLELKTNLLPVADESGNLGAADKRFAKIWTVNLAVTNMIFGNVIPNIDNTYDLGENATPKRWRDIWLSGALRLLGGGVQINLLPNAHATYDLGADLTRWRDIYASGVGKFGTLEAMTFINCASIIATGNGKFNDLNIGTYIVITDGRVLQNVTADAAVITSGQFGLGRMPRGDLGLILEGGGASFDPLYVEPDGRYTPAGHTHGGGDISSGTVPEDHVPSVYSGKITFNGGISTNSVNCANFSATDIVFENNFRITEAEKLGLPKGLAFLNPKGKILLFLDAKGNLKVAGKIGKFNKKVAG